ncbi:MAG: hypothetical protein IPL12_07680 [Bacteroidetes bacterium]|nr:hypothetical protein [Bacteroidota bacterium]
MLKQLQPGDRVTYYFEVWDNDAVHGSKNHANRFDAVSSAYLRRIATNKDDEN